VKTIDISKTTGQLRDYAENARTEVVVVTRRGKPVAAVVGVKEFDLESLSLGMNPRFAEIIASARQRLKKEGGIPASEMRQRLGLSRTKSRRKR
jgi:prevent-host-death family protein